MNAVPPTTELDAALYRARFDLAIAAAGIGTFDWNLRTGELIWDDRLIAMFGHTAETFDHSISAFRDRLHPSDRDRVMAVLTNAVEAGAPFEIEYQIVLPNGRHRWIEARGQCVYDASGTAVRFVGAALDSTDLRTEQAKLGRLLETMPAAFISIDRDWQLTYINSEAERMFDIGRNGQLGRRLWDVYPGVEFSPFGEAYRRAVETGEPQTVEGPSPRTGGLYLQGRAFPTEEGLSVYLVDVTENRSREELIRLEAAAGAQMAESLDLEQAVRGLAQLVVPRLGDWSLVSVSEPDGSVTDLASWHADPALRAAVATYAANRLEGLADPAPVRQVQRSHDTVVIRSGLTDMMRPLLGSRLAADALELLKPESAVVIPLVARGELLGILSICRGVDRPALSDTEVSVAESLARRAAMALQNARLFAHQRSVAHSLQDAMLTRLPRTATVQLDARYLPAGSNVQVGGDWYDALMLPDGSKALMIGDVVGHDIGAAAVMGQLRNLLRAFVWDRDESPAQAVARLDRATRDLHVDTLASLTLVRITPRVVGQPRTVRWSSAGHPPPVVVTPGEPARYLDQVADPLIGVLPDARRHDQQLELASSSILLLYTDGLIERRGTSLDDRRALLLERVNAHAQLPLGQLLDAVTADLVGEGREDDVAVLAARLS